MYQVRPQQVQPVQAPAGQVSPQLVQGIMVAIMMVWVVTYVISQVVKLVKGEEVERPPLPK